MSAETLLKMTEDKSTNVMIGLSAEKLLELMRSGILCGADIRALDSETKQLIQQACLHACVNKVCRECDFSDVCGVEWERSECSQCQKNEVNPDLQTVHWQAQQAK